MGLAARSAAEAAPAHTTALTAKAAEKIFKLFMSPPAKLIRNQFESEPYPLRKYRSSAFLGLTSEFGEVLHNRRKGRPGTQARKLKPAGLKRRATLFVKVDRMDTIFQPPRSRLSPGLAQPRQLSQHRGRCFTVSGLSNV